MARSYNFNNPTIPQNYNNPDYDDDDLDDDPSEQFDQGQINNAAAQQAADSVVNYEPVPNVLPGVGAPPADQLEQDVPVNTAGDTGNIEEALNEDTIDDPGDLDALGTLDDNGPGTDEEMPLDAGAADGAAPGPTGDTTTVDETEEEPDQVNEEDILFDGSMGNIDETVFDNTEIGVEGSGLDDLNLDLDGGMLADEGDDNPYAPMDDTDYADGSELDPNYDADTETVISDDEIVSDGMVEATLANSDMNNIAETIMGSGAAEEQAQTFRDLLEENLMAKMMEDAQAAGQRDAGRAIAAARAQAGRGQMGMSGGMIAAQSDAVSNAVANAEDRLFNQQMQAGRLGAGMETEQRNQLITAIGVAEDLGMGEEELRSFISTIFPDMDPNIIADFGLGEEEVVEDEDEVVTNDDGRNETWGEQQYEDGNFTSFNDLIEEAIMNDGDPNSPVFWSREFGDPVWVDGNALDSSYYSSLEGVNGLFGGQREKTKNGKTYYLFKDSDGNEIWVLPPSN